MQFFIRLLLGVILSFYLFPIGFTFLPESINTKALLAVLGIIACVIDYVPRKAINFDFQFIISFFIALVFSIFCFFTTDFNNTNDYSYAYYISSFFVWVFGAYFVGWCLRVYYGVLTYRSLCYYLLVVCVVQCVLALLIDEIPALKNLVDSYVQQGQYFLNNVNRLYGIGASLDPAGVRFSVVLIMTMALLNNDEKLRNDKLMFVLVLIGFFFVALVGNMISRTTTIGFGLALGCFFIGSGPINFNIKISSIKLGFIYGFIITFVLIISVFLYNTNPDFNSNIRFAFEGFFNWAETGVWRTDSTDTLHNVMWIWPEDLKTWVIGSGLFGNYIYSTDIGYCRFILYCGLVGFSIFASLFIYNSIAFMFKVPKYWILFALLFLLTFIIWLKVATDIFFIYALLFNVDKFIDNEKPYRDLLGLNNNG